MEDYVEYKIKIPINSLGESEIQNNKIPCRPKFTFSSESRSVATEPHTYKLTKSRTNRCPR